MSKAKTSGKGARGTSVFTVKLTAYERQALDRIVRNYNAGVGNPADRETASSVIRRRIAAAATTKSMRKHDVVQ